MEVGLMQPFACDGKAICVGKVPLFAELLPEQLLRVHALIHRAAYGPGEIIFRPGEEARDFFLVSQGRIKIAQLSPEGKVLLLRILEAGDFFGELSLLAGEASLPYQAEALSEVHLCRIVRSEMEQLLAATPALTRRLLAAVAGRLRQAERQIEHLGLRDVRSRLAAVILDLFRGAGALTNGARLPFAWRQRDLAEYLATTQESVSRKLGRLEQDGIVRITGEHEIILLDGERLEALAEGSETGLGV